MDIIVRDSDEGKNFRLMIPSALILNSFAASFLPRFLKSEGVNITSRQARHMVKSLKKFKRRHKDWTLVEVQEKDGDRIKIKL